MAETHNLPVTSAVQSLADLPIENFHTVDSWAVTKPTYHSETFYWTIKDFLFTSNNGKSPLFSPEFLEKSYLDSIPRERKWQLRLIPQQPPKGAVEKPYMSVHLYLIESIGEFLCVDQSSPDVFKTTSEVKIDPITRANFEVCVLDDRGISHRPVGGRNTEPCMFQLKGGWGYNYFFSLDTVIAQKKIFLPMGDFTIKCQIWIQCNSEMHDYRQGHGAVWHDGQKINEDQQRLRLKNDVGKILKDGSFTDMTVQIGSSDVKFSVHKIILAARSPVFEAMFTASHQTQESQEGLVKIQDFDAAVVNAMLEYLYTDTVDPVFLQARCVDLFQISDKYCLPGLREICKKEIADNLTVDNCIDVLVMADMHHCVWLKEKCLRYAHVFKNLVMKGDKFWRICKAYPCLCQELYMYSK